MSSRVREPIQVYLSEEERARLERAAGELGVSRSEVLRRGIEAIGAGPEASGPLRDLVEQGLASPARVRKVEPPPRVADLPFEELIGGLGVDRSER